MAYIYKNKENGRWYVELDCLGAIYTDEITDKEIVESLENGKKALDEAIKEGLLQ